MLMKFRCLSRGRILNACMTSQLFLELKGNFLRLCDHNFAFGIDIIRQANELNVGLQGLQGVNIFFNGTPDKITASERKL